MTRFLVCISRYLLIKIETHNLYDSKTMASELLITKLAMKGIIGYLLITLHFLPKGKKKVPKLFVTYP